MGFQNSSWNISTSRLMILAASVFEISCGAEKRSDTQTNEGKSRYPRDCCRCR